MFFFFFCVFVCFCVFMCVHVFVYMYVCMCVHACMYMCVFVCVYACTCMCVYVCALTLNVFELCLSLTRVFIFIQWFRKKDMEKKWEIVYRTFSSFVTKKLFEWPKLIQSNNQQQTDIIDLFHMSSSRFMTHISFA